MAGVSEATVSRVFNRVGPIKEETRLKVLKAAETLGYYPNAIAQSFARRKSGNLGVVLPYVPKVHIFSTYYFSEILSGIGEQVRELGYDMLLIFRKPGDDNGYTELFRSQKIDACILLGTTDTPEERKALRALKEANHPFCLVNQHFAGEEFLEVDADHEQGAYEAVKHLLDEGYRRIAFLNGPPGYSNSADRLKGYVRAMTEAGIFNPGYDPDKAIPAKWLETGNYSRTSGYEAAFRFARHLDSIDAVFAANDRMGIGLIQGFRELGVIPGKDIAIVGYDDSDGARITDPPLTSVAVPFYRMGALAAKLLLTENADEAVSEFGEGVNHISGHLYQMATRLVVRSSSARSQA
ncbi:LacI family DNA-binding transcriptional regulator [Paenibacillus sp. FSL M7-1455]|jgi:LacI family transcriptional regulator|uniref:LacI family transcriptional regulator n=2 Tax=Paenibacillus TaxID=44249 RepID=A0ABQ4LZ19_9BACL|nr:LacI family DNA-binding transcriptional regulator [Paenibacillus cookii]KHF34077.1 Catabolite control protein A [Paenibacillus sp. P1XP2]GIO68541.1 LacI family transcriptional regulator [Paenibacillus cookii]